jgi:diadenosine tetraphosphate (Ap4A) HIT family hydrolase
MCWLCDNYEEVGTTVRKVKRLVFQDPNTFVVVPKDSHVTHHLIVALRSHKEGLIDCSPEDNAHIGRTIAIACQTLKSMGYSHVYGGCYSDEGHIHYHLIPFNMGTDKQYKGSAMHWLAEKERVTDSHPFDCMTDLQQQQRLEQIEIVVAEIRAKWPTIGCT